MIWQPIETAPRNGTIFLGYFANNDDDTIFLSEIMWVGKDEVVIGNGEPVGPSKWFSLLSQSVVNPTHWMPLPEPPK
jgi:hypothetical protein